MRKSDPDKDKRDVRKDCTAILGGREEGGKLGLKLGKSFEEASAKPEVERSGCCWRPEPVWVPSGSSVTHNEGPKELPLQSLREWSR